MSAHWTEAVRLIDAAEEIATTPGLCRPEFMPVMRGTLHQLSAYVSHDYEQRSLDELMRACRHFETQGRTAWLVFSKAWLSFWEVWSSSREIALFITGSLQASAASRTKKPHKAGSATTA